MRFRATAPLGSPRSIVIQRSMYLLINLAQNDNATHGTSEVDMVALPCRDIEELAQQVALKHYAREQARLAMRAASPSFS